MSGQISKINMNGSEYNVIDADLRYKINNSSSLIFNDDDNSIEVDTTKFITISQLQELLENYVTTEQLDNLLSQLGNNNNENYIALLINKGSYAFSDDLQGGAIYMLNGVYKPTENADEYKRLPLDVGEYENTIIIDKVDYQYDEDSEGANYEWYGITESGWYWHIYATSVEGDFSLMVSKTTEEAQLFKDIKDGNINWEPVGDYADCEPLEFSLICQGDQETLQQKHDYRFRISGASVSAVNGNYWFGTVDDNNQGIQDCQFYTNGACDLYSFQEDGEWYTIISPKEGNEVDLPYYTYYGNFISDMQECENPDDLEWIDRGTEAVQFEIRHIVN